MKHRRKVHINGEAWTYTIGKCAIIIYSPHGKRMRISPGSPGNESNVAITPHDIKAYICRKIIGSIGRKPATAREAKRVVIQFLAPDIPIDVAIKQFYSKHDDHRETGAHGQENKTIDRSLHKTKGWLSYHLDKTSGWKIFPS